MAAQGRDERASIAVEGRTRTFVVHLPPGYDGNAAVPLVFLLHGAGGNGAQMQRLAQFDAIADANGAIAVYPDGVFLRWNDGRPNTPQMRGVDDVAFFAALLDKLAQTYAVDPARVYAAGISNGGFMAGRLACDLPERFAAVGIVSSAVSGELAQSCPPGRAVPVWFSHGADDPIIPTAGQGMSRAGGAVGTFLSTADSIAFWVNRNGCAMPPVSTALPATVDDGTQVRRDAYGGCHDGADVIAYEISGSGHVWPGGGQYLPARTIGKTTHNLDASAALWGFFAAHPKMT